MPPARSAPSRKPPENGEAARLREHNRTLAQNAECRAALWAISKGIYPASSVRAGEPMPYDDAQALAKSCLDLIAL